MREPTERRNQDYAAPPLKGADLHLGTDRDRILEAMIECCAEQGFWETSVEDVVTRAGVGRDGFEASFADTEECALAAIARVSSEVAAVVATSGGGRQASRLSGARAILELLASRPKWALFVCIQARQGGTASMREALESSVGMLAVTVERLGGGEAIAGSVRAQLGGAEALLRRELVAGRAEQLPELLPELTYAVLVPSLGQREALAEADDVRRALEEGR